MRLSDVTRPEQIDWTGFFAIGAGAYGTVFVRGYRSGRYAIKVGRIRPEEVQGLRDASAVGLAVPIYSFMQGVPRSKLPHRIAVEAAQYLRAFDVLIMGRAIPGDYAIERRYDDPYDARAEKKAAVRALLAEAQKHNLDWTDSHEGNFGYYKGKPVILDGLNF